MAGEDIAISAAVRRIFARHWVDNTLVSVMAHRGVVHITGIMHKVNAIDEKDDIGEDTLQIIESEIKRIKGVKRIIFSLDGWVKDGGQFIKTATRRKFEMKEERRILKEEERKGEQR
ncbi:MAG: hypothetical protein N2234_02400 [Planctomycetota bacterium]|nr:hypothetical protein [Planctomycetota bacterium]